MTMQNLQFLTIEEDGKVDKLDGLLHFLDLVEKAKLSYTIRKEQNSLLVIIAAENGQLQVCFTGDGEILFYRLEDGRLDPCGAEILDEFFCTMS